MVSRVTGGGFLADGDLIRLCNGTMVAPSLPLYQSDTIVGTHALQPLVKIPLGLEVAASGGEDCGLEEGLSLLRVLYARGGRFTLVVPTDLAQITPSSWVWASPGHERTAWSKFDEQCDALFPCDVPELPSSDDDDLSTSDDSDWPADDGDSSEPSSWRPSDEDSPEDSPEDEHPRPDERKKRLQYGDVLEELGQWVKAPQGYRTFARSRGHAPSRFLRLAREWYDRVYMPPLVIPRHNKPPCIVMRLRSLAMGMRLVAIRSAAARAAVEKGEPVRKRLRARQGGPVREVQRGPTMASLRLPDFAASAAAAPLDPRRGPYYALYIDTAGGRIGGTRLTTAAIRKAPPDPPHSSADLRSLLVIAAWMGAFKGTAPRQFISSLPALPPNTVHHHDLASFWSLSSADPGVACCALDTSRARSYWTKKPCVCNGTLRDIHNVNRPPNSAGVIPLRPLTVIGTDKRMEYVYPRGHCVKNAVLSVWGTLCIAVAKYDNDLATRLEREFPRGDGFNPNLRDMSDKQKSERKTRKPAVDGRCRNAKEFVRRSDEYIAALLADVRDTEIVRIGAASWSVRRFIMYTIQYLRCLLDPSPDLAFKFLEQLGRTLFYVYKKWLASLFPYRLDVSKNPKEFQRLSRDEVTKLRDDIQFNSATVMCGVPVHYAFEHAWDVFLRYPYEVAESLQLEECEENSFLEFAEKVPKMIMRRLQRIPYLRGVGEAVLTISLTGWPGQTDERNRRYWSWTDRDLSHSRPL